MGFIGKPRYYKGFKLKSWRDVWKYYTIEVEKDDKFVTDIPTYEREKKKAIDIAKLEIDKITTETKKKPYTSKGKVKVIDVYDDTVRL